MTGNLQEVLDLRRWREADFNQADRTLLSYAENFTIESNRIRAEDIRCLRNVGFTDPQILDITLCAGYRHFITRIADATGIELDAELGISPILIEAYSHTRGTLPDQRAGLADTKPALDIERPRDRPWVEVADQPENDPTLAPVWSAWLRDYGMIPGLLYALSKRPLAVSKLSSFWRLACFGGSKLGRTWEARLGIAVAARLGSPWLLAIYRDALWKSTGSPTRLNLSANWKESDLSDQERIIISFAERITDQANSITQADVDRIRQAGLKDSEILDVIVATALLNCIGRMANALGVPADLLDRVFVRESSVDATGKRL